MVHEFREKMLWLIVKERHVSVFVKQLVALTLVTVTPLVSAETIPTLTLNGNLLPCISHNINTALSKGLPSMLQRDTVNSQTKQNHSCSTVGAYIQEFNKQDDMIYTCSGYPFASTSAGGVGAQIMMVPMKEQKTHSVLLSSFYERYRIKHGNHFMVAVVYSGTRMNNMNTTHVASPSVPGMVLKCN